MKLRNITHQENTHHISHRVIYHKLHISSVWSLLIPPNRSLCITILNTIYTLTPRGMDTTAMQHTIYYFVNPYQGYPYLIYTHEDEYHNQSKVSKQNLTTTTSLPSTQTTSRRPHILIIHTMTHIPNLDTTFIFPRDSIQHQPLIPTLTTRIFLSIPNLNIYNLSWNIIRYTAIHQHRTYSHINYLIS